MEAGGESCEDSAFGVGMEGAGDGHTAFGGAERVVVSEFAGKVELGILGEGVVDHIATGTGGSGGSVDGAGGGACDEEMGEVELMFDALDEFGAVDRGGKGTDAALAGGFGREELDEVEGGFFVGV